MKRWRSRLVATAAVALTTAAFTTVLPAGAAHAGPSCDPVIGCSVVANSSNTWVVAWHDWTCGWGTTASSSTGCAGGDTFFVDPGQRTPGGQDWDVVRVDAGWCYRIMFINWWGKTWAETYNRIGAASPVYVKVEDGSSGTVLGQSNSSCP